ncbi:TPA: abortive infection system antitoxin AbiGi family protein, partial [Escherichia coli]
MSAIENQETVIQAVNSLHPTTLFHFTKNEEAFYSILTELYFKPFLARERIVGVKGRRNFAVPMVSFCDIKLSQIKDHSGKYGEFGFGLTKEWAEKNDLHPVLYMNQGS